MLYQLNLANIISSQRVPIESPDTLGITEKHIEDFLGAHLVEIIPEDQLMLLAQERRYQEEADILALDRNGCLFIFELKRWKSSAENLLQVMRYGQIFGRYDYCQLENLVRRRQRLEGSLRDKHAEYFGLTEPLMEASFNVDQRFIVVTNGVDRDTLEAIRYWSKKGVRIDSLTYKLYLVEGHPHIQFDTYNPELDVIFEENPGVYIVNTSSTYMDAAWKEMVGDGVLGRAAAYYDRKNAVQKISKGSTVYLYHTGVGVIAKGKAVGGVVTTDFDRDVGEELFVPIKFEWALCDPKDWDNASVTAHEINSETGSSYRFRQTVFNASSEMQVAIDKLWSKKVKS